MRWPVVLLILVGVGGYTRFAEAKSGGGSFDVDLKSRWWQADGLTTCDQVMDRLLLRIGNLDTKTTSTKTWLICLAVSLAFVALGGGVRAIMAVLHRRQREKLRLQIRRVPEGDLMV